MDKTSMVAHTQMGRMVVSHRDKMHHKPQARLLALE